MLIGQLLCDKVLVSPLFPNQYSRVSARFFLKMQKVPIYPPASKGSMEVANLIERTESLFLGFFKRTYLPKITLQNNGSMVAQMAERATQY